MRLCLNKALFTGTEIVISHNFHVSQSSIFFSFSLQPFKNIKVILSMDHAKPDERLYLALDHSLPTVTLNYIYKKILLMF